MPPDIPSPAPTILVMDGQSHTHITRIFPSLKDVSFLRTPFRDDDLLAIIETLLPPRARPLGNSGARTLTELHRLS
jgi:hypothetical protein